MLLARAPVIERWMIPMIPMRHRHCLITSSRFAPLRCEVSRSKFDFQHSEVPTLCGVLSRIAKQPDEPRPQNRPEFRVSRAPRPRFRRLRQSNARFAAEAPSVSFQRSFGFASQVGRHAEAVALMCGPLTNLYMAAWPGREVACWLRESNGERGGKIYKLFGPVQTGDKHQDPLMRHQQGPSN